jgi:hypothetical protein
MSGNGSSGILPMIKLKPQFLHSYLSPSDKPGVSQVSLQAVQVVKGRTGLRLKDNEFSVCIVGPILLNEAQLKNRTIT